jgi:hypothetical protein
MPFLIGRVAGVVEPIGVHAARGAPGGALFVSDAEPDGIRHPACGPDAASRPGVEAA